ncbi:calcium-responsive transactivator [Bombina bombina]|uniref:calcium-responsive transactivator n=1 Tax=Bombina bombina TaxID=8345 RepID=UPI00235A4779|nr:calcium-responsive transactivator [Bombina bombina]
MSVAFASARPRGKGEVTQQTIQKMLDENHHLIQCIMDYQSKGKTAECTQYQQILHRNLVYLATIADSNQNMQSLLPAPPTQNMNLGPGGMNQTGPSQTLHSQGSLSDALGASLPPTSLMQSQISNGPNHVAMQQSGQTTMPTTSMSMAVSSHGTAPGYSHAVPSSQNMPMQSQGSIGNYVSRANMNMSSNPVSMMHQQAASSHYTSAQGGGGQHYQGQTSIPMMSQSNQGSSMMGQRPLGPYRPSQQSSSQQYLGQEEYYSEQYAHSQGSSEPMSQQYYTDGHSEYSYQQSSYGEQSYDRTFEDSSQHYYEGGNTQYSQQQTGYQQGTGQQQAYSQQQYPNQQNYPGQQQGYVPSQGASSQYSTYQQGQSQQYSTYRAPQSATSAQQQRPYGYEQGQYGNYQQ